jgi:CheY-like chemotaxis protein
VAYSIVQKHDGHISVTSDPGRGSVFTVYLPAIEGEGATAAHTVHPIGADRGRILVMDDDDVIRSAATQMLSLLGYVAVVAADGAQAVQRYRDAMHAGAPFDAVILDLTVPGGMGGVEALRELRVVDPGVCAIVSSGYSADPVMARYRNHGFADALPKPYSLDEMGVVIRRVLDRKRD